MEKDVEKLKKSPNWISRIAIIISVISILISVYTFYNEILKPFDLIIDLYPEIQIQHKLNFGMYVRASFLNNSPQNGLITQTAIIMFKDTNPEDKYIITFDSFRTSDSNKIYSPSLESLPIFLKPLDRESRIINYLFLKENEQFPISSGTYVCELLLWIDYNNKPDYRKEFKFTISADMLDWYKMRRDMHSTSLSEPIKISGYAPLTPRKITMDEYEQLFD